MAVVAVVFDGTRVTDAEALVVGGTTVWTGGVQEPDFIYQGTYSVSQKIKTTEAGPQYYNAATSHDYSGTRRTVIFKILITTIGILSDTASTSGILEIGTGSRTNYYRYYVVRKSTYPPQGGWLIIPIDPYIAGYRSNTVLSPTLTTINYYGYKATMTTTTAKTENMAIDAIDFIPNGSGLTLTAGTSPDPAGTFQSFATFDESDNTKRYGLCTTKNGVFYVIGTLTIGSATQTTFTDSNQTLVFPDGRFDTGFAGIKISLAHASTNVSMTAITFVGKGSYGADGATADTRPNFTVSNTSGTATLTNCSLNSFNSTTLTSNVTLSGCTFVKCQSLIQASATISNTKFDSAPVATGVAFLTSNAALGSITNCTFVSSGTGHAIVITSTTGTPFTFVGNKFSGYSGTPGSNLVASSGSNDAAIYNNSGGAITISITSNGDTPSVRNGAGASTTIVSNVNVTVTVQDAGGNVIVGAQVAVYKTSDNSTIISSTATNGSGLVTGSAPASTGPVYIRVRQSNTADSTRYYPNSAVGSIGATDFSITVTMTEDVTVT